MLIAAGCTSSSKEAATETPAPVDEVTLTISGSGGTTRILNAVKPAFEADTPGYHLEVLTGTGTGGGVQGVVDGTLDVAAMARLPKDDEAVEYVEFGQSGQAIFVHPDVSVTELSTEQTVAIFSGEITNWSEVDGEDQEIVLCVRDEGDSSTQALREAVFGDTPFPETAQVLTSQGDMIAIVEGTPNSVGFGTWPAVLADSAGVKAIALDGVLPSDPTYPITGVVGVGYLSERQTDVQPLFDWLLSENGQAALQEFGVITSQ
jgi:phosphate transport system substrate-binding protein